MPENYLRKTKRLLKEAIRTIEEAERDAGNRDVYANKAKALIKEALNTL